MVLRQFCYNSRANLLYVADSWRTDPSPIEGDVVLLHYTRAATAGMIAAGGWRIHVSKKNSKSI